MSVHESKALKAAEKRFAEASAAYQKACDAYHAAVKKFDAAHDEMMDARLSLLELKRRTRTRGEGRR